MCEIDRFMRLTNNVVEVVSFIVPRKTQATHFQADIFPPAPSGEPGLTASRWLSGASADIPTTSMKPAHLLEDAPVSSLSGSSGTVAAASSPGSPPLMSQPSLTSLPTAPASGGPPVHAGPMLLEVKGWFYTAFEPKYFSISANQTLYCFANKESAEAIFSVPLASILEIKIDPNNGKTNHSLSLFSTSPLLIVSPFLVSYLLAGSRFTLLLPATFHNLEAYNQADRDKWMRALSNNKAPPPAAAVQEVYIDIL